jgi:hypothetical protein
MKISVGMFADFLQCPTKCWLHLHDEPVSEQGYALWARNQTESYRKETVNRLQAEQGAESAPLLARQAIDWRLAVNVPVTAIHPHGLVITACLPAVEYGPPVKRGQPAQFMPLRLVFRQKPDQTDRLLLGFEALALAGMTGHPVRGGKLIYGDTWYCSACARPASIWAWTFWIFCVPASLTRMFTRQSNAKLELIKRCLAARLLEFRQ